MTLEELQVEELRLWNVFYTAPCHSPEEQNALNEWALIAEKLKFQKSSPTYQLCKVAQWIAEKK